MVVFGCASKRLSYNYCLRLYRLYCKVRYHTMATLETLRFQNLALRRLPIDQENRNYVRIVNGACFSRVQPTPVDNPKIVAYSADALALLDLPLSELKRDELAEYFSGNRLLLGSEPAAHCYCGHQFGYFSGQLGDGAAMYLGEVVNSRNERWEVQLKGAGLTPYSRTADGRKVMRSSIREFLCSEAMHYLGIPTTRAGTCVTSDTEVIRDIFYDGHPTKEKCTIVSRIAPTFLRFGSFEIFKTLDPVTKKVGPSVGRTDILKDMLDYTIEIFYPEVHEKYKDDTTTKYSEFFKQVVLKTAQLVAQWQCIGFCHGVLNTDNMSIIGLTLDYGPFGFMDMYSSDHICNGSDTSGRYSFENQPTICLWNLKKLAEAIRSIIPSTVTTPLFQFFEEFSSTYLHKMRCKLGLIKVEDPNDVELISKFLSTMEKTGADFTNTFRCLSILHLPTMESHHSSLSSLKEALLKQCYPIPAIIKSLTGNLNSRQVEILQLLKNSPHLNIIDSELDKILAKVEKAEKLEQLSAAEKEKLDASLWNDWLEIYVKRLAKECEGSVDLDELQRERVCIMNSSNPRFILRNHVAQKAIEKAESGDFKEVWNVLSRLQKPYDDALQLEDVLNQPSTSKVLEDSYQNTSFIQSKIVDELPPIGSLSIRVT